MRAHGTHAKYVVDRCRCDPCRAANSDYERTRARAIRSGTWQPYVDAGNTRAHLRWLSACGIGHKTVAQLSGVSHGTISKLIYGDPTRNMAPSARVRVETAQRILAVKPAHVPIPPNSRRRVDGTRTRVLLDDLLRRGWTKTELAQRLGSKSPALQVGQAAEVNVSTARKVELLHAQLKHQTPPARRSRWDHRRRRSAA